jgi:hypothetical protein
VVTLSPKRCDLVEYRRFPGQKAEIQIRSILQHAWAEIEHDLGYKRKEDVPREIRRRFSRIAGLLELVDTEFVKIRDELQKYVEGVGKIITESPEEVEVNKDSLKVFIANSPTVYEIEKAMRAAKPNVTFTEPPDPVLSGRLEICVFFGIKTIKELDDVLRSRKGKILRFFERYFDITDKPVNAPKSISIFYLGYILATEGGLETTVKYLEAMKMAGPSEETRKTANDLLKIAKAI